MSSSNSNRGGGRLGYHGSKDWINNSKSRRKNFYSSSSAAAAAEATGTGSIPNPSATTSSSTEATNLPNLSRRDFKSNGPGSSSLTHSKDSQPTRNGSSYSSNYYFNSGYGGYDNGSYRSDSWRKASGESRRSAGSQKPTLSGSSSGSLTSTSSPASAYKNGRYDSYTTDTGAYGPNRWKSSRNFGASSARYSAKDRIRNGKSSLTNSYLPSSNSVPLGSSTASNPDSFGPAANSTGYKYYDPSKSYGSYYSGSYAKDKGSSLSQSRVPFSNPRDYKSRYGNRYGGSTLINPAEKRAKEKELVGEQDSVNEYDDSDDVGSNSKLKHEDDDNQSEVTENGERDIHNKERMTREYNEADETQDDISQQAIEEKSVETSAEPELKDVLEDEVYLKKVRIETPPVIAEADTKVAIEYDETSTIDGVENVYRYPLPEIPHKYEEMKKEFQQLGGSSLKYLLSTPISDFSDYPFFINNYEEFYQQKRTALVNILKEKNTNVQTKTLDLLNEYNEMSKKWGKCRLKMDQQLRVLHPPDDEMKRELDSSDLRKQYQQQQPSVGSTTTTSPHVGSFDLPTVSSRRSSRRHGDLVTTEAEFQEILLTLGQQQEDPLLKAQRVAADIPDMIMDPVEKNEVKFMDSNNAVNDKHAWASRIGSDFHNTFSEKEHELFTEAFCLFPKRFGAISRYMGGLRTAAECVLHYYMTKKQLNYKQLLVQRRKASKKSKRVKSSGRPKSTPQQPADQPEGYLAGPTSAVSDGSQDVVSADLSVPNELVTPSMTPVAEVPGAETVPIIETGRKKRATGTKATEKRKQKAELEASEDGQKPTEKKRKRTTKKPVSADGITKPAEKKKRVSKKQAAEEALAASMAQGVPATNAESTKVSIGALTNVSNYPSNIIQPEINTGSSPIMQQYAYHLQQSTSQNDRQQYAQPIEQQKVQVQQQYEQQLRFQQQQQQQPQPQQPHIYAQYQAQYQPSYQSQSPSFAPQRSAPVFPSIRNLLTEQDTPVYQQSNYAPAPIEQHQVHAQQQLQQQQQPLPSYQQPAPHPQSSSSQPQSHRTSSIMSLLNSDEKPAVAQQRAKTNLRDLLN
ncbi:SNT1 [Candida margitis]|uniref:SNT1 n=1 Tax=Candida margitis TaxID=1775924 RepID=UPI002226BF73|nr:SNT1 [Candida margitis]KAI5967583.1 SNT1 [Candida margitis]